MGATPRKQREQVDRLIDTGYRALDEGDFQRAIDLGRKAARECRSLPEEDAFEFGIDALLLVGEACSEIGAVADALEAYRQIRALDPDATEASFGEGRLAFATWDFDRAAALFTACVDTTAEIQSRIRYYQAMIAEFAGRAPEAARLFAEAAQLDPDYCVMPEKIDPDDVLAMLDEIVHALPDDVQRALDNVVFDVVDLPDPKIDGTSHPPTILGLYSGATVAENVFAEQFMPASIRIFRKNVERIAYDREQLEEELRITILHEIGHHLGWDDADLEERGLA